MWNIHNIDCQLNLCWKTYGGEVFSFFFFFFFNLLSCLCFGVDRMKILVLRLRYLFKKNAQIIGIYKETES